VEHEILRFIEREPQSALSPTDLFSHHVVAEWDLRGKVHDFDADPNPPMLNESISIDADAVDLIEVTIDGMQQGTLALRWSRQDEPFGRAQQIQLQAEHQDREDHTTFYFVPGTHSAWTGEITGLRLYTDQSLRQSVTPLRARLLRRSIDRVKARSALSRAWKVDLGRDIRNSLVAPIEGALSRRFRLPPRSELLLGYGLLHGVDQPVEFQVWIHDGTKRHQMFSKLLQPRSGEEMRWLEARVDLSKFAGKSVDIELETVHHLQGGDPSGFGLWANPIVANEAGEEQPNVILVSVDTLRADHLSLYGYRRPTSRYLDRWASDEAIIFEQAVTQAPSTLPAHVSMLTGLNAFHHGVNHDPAPSSLKFLAEYLRESGYVTAAQTGGGFVHPAFGFLQGFDEYRYWVWGRDRVLELESGIEASLKFVERHGDHPFFLLLHTYETHAPYRAREPYYSDFAGLSASSQSLLWLQLPEPREAEGFRIRPNASLEFRQESTEHDSTDRPDVQQAIDRYDSSIAYVDSQLQRLWQRLEEKNIRRRSLIIITSDHGEAFGEHEFLGHGTLYDDNLLVPLAIGLPASQYAGQRIDSQVRSIDLVPTIMEVIGGPMLTDLDGASLMPLIEAKSSDFPTAAWSYGANSNFGVSLRIDKRLKYIFNDSVWPQIYGSEELIPLKAGPEAAQDRDSSPETSSQLQNMVHRSLVTRVTGLKMMFSNRGTVPLVGSVESRLLEPTRIKSVDLPCGCLQWVNGGGFSFQVPPRVSYSLMIDMRPSENLDLAVRIARSEVVERPAEWDWFEVPANGEMASLEWMEEEWRLLSEVDDDLEVGIRISWFEMIDEASPDNKGIDSRLDDQLQALGYLQ
jgi:arylsulfatase A-like enzyme